MVTATTEGIQVSVKPQFEPFYSQTEKNLFVFSYAVRIQNLTNHTIKLISRKWAIFDSIGHAYEVKGNGVVGVNPVLEPGEFFNYTSGCNLHSTFGSMSGFYTIERLKDGKIFEIVIPCFLMEVPYLLN